ALAAGAACTVPTAVVAQVWRAGGARQANLARLLSGCEPEPLDLELARRAGELVARAGAEDFVDALVVLGAAARGDTVVTSDPVDIRVLASAGGSRLRIVTV
ncbi:MAG TPA: PIN domain-containing protein, partial [Acidimicrobiales bacterium]|nr:PIN domain-containing protein [Acidimicrobiales bacterium]